MKKVQYSTNLLPRGEAVEQKQRSVVWCESSKANLVQEAVADAVMLLSSPLQDRWLIPQLLALVLQDLCWVPLQELHSVKGSLLSQGVPSHIQWLIPVGRRGMLVIKIWPPLLTSLPPYAQDGQHWRATSFRMTVDSAELWIANALYFNSSLCLVSFCVSPKGADPGGTPSELFYCRSSFQILFSQKSKICLQRLL